MTKRIKTVLFNEKATPPLEKEGEKGRMGEINYQLFTVHKYRQILTVSHENQFGIW